MIPEKRRQSAKTLREELLQIIRMRPDNAYKNAYRISGGRQVMQNSDNIITTARTSTKKFTVLILSCRQNAPKFFNDWQ